MLRWLNAQSRVSDRYAFERDAAGRALIPAVELTTDMVDASFETKSLAIAWAKDWLGIVGEVDAFQAVADLTSALHGKKQKRPYEEERLIRMASFALYQWREAGHRARTRSAFPWLTVSVVDARTCCAGAAALDGQMVPSMGAPLLPLPDCDVDFCHCHYLQATEGKRKRLLAAPP